MTTAQRRAVLMQPEREGLQRRECRYEIMCGGFDLPKQFADFFRT